MNFRIIFCIFIVIPLLPTTGIHAKSSGPLRKWIHAGLLQALDNQTKRIDNPRWDRKNRDCAGLLRYIIWEAYQEKRPVPDQQFYRSLKPLPTDQNYIDFMSGRPGASGMRSYARLLGRAMPDGLQEGDILIYEDGRSAHLMIFFRESGTGRQMVVYHTGSVPGELRYVPLEMLYEHANPYWHPSASNPAFAGFYRLRILE